MLEQKKLFINIAMLGVYVNNEYWSVANMKTPYDIKFLECIQIIY